MRRAGAGAVAVLRRRAARHRAPGADGASRPVRPLPLEAERAFRETPRRALALAPVGMLAAPSATGRIGDRLAMAGGTGPGTRGLAAAPRRRRGRGVADAGRIRRRSRLGLRRPRPRLRGRRRRWRRRGLRRSGRAPSNPLGDGPKHERELVAPPSRRVPDQQPSPSPGRPHRPSHNPRHPGPGPSPRVRAAALWQQRVRRRPEWLERRWFGSDGVRRQPIRNREVAGAGGSVVLRIRRFTRPLAPGKNPGPRTRLGPNHGRVGRGSSSFYRPLGSCSRAATNPPPRRGGRGVRSARPPLCGIHVCPLPDSA